VVRRSILIGTFLWALFVINDIIKDREGLRANFAATVSLRFGVIGLALFSLLITYTHSFLREVITANGTVTSTGNGVQLLPWLIASVIVLFGSAQVVSGVIEGDTTDPTYSVAIVVISSTSSAFFRLPCWASIASNTLLYIVYVVVTGVSGAYDTASHFGTTSMWLLIGTIIFSLHAYDREWNIRSSYLAQRRLEYEEHKSQKVLLKMLPLSVIQELRTGAEFCHERHSNISVLFSHICDFDAITSSATPNEVIGLLNQIFSRFDQLTDEYGVYKVETIGDVYLVSAGVPEPRPDHANALAHLAVSMMESLPEFQSEERAIPVQLKIGIHSGPVIAGVVGLKYPRFRLMGDTVNTASRMSSTCHAGDIQVTPSAFHQLHPEEFIIQYRGLIPVKGKGKLKTYLIKGRVAKIDALCELKSATTGVIRTNKEGMAHIISSPAVHVEGTGEGMFIPGPRTPATPATPGVLLHNANAQHTTNTKQMNGGHSDTLLSPVAGINGNSLTPAATTRNYVVGGSKQFSQAQIAKWTDGSGDNNTPVAGSNQTQLQQVHGSSVRVTDDPDAVHILGMGATETTHESATIGNTTPVISPRTAVRIHLPGHKTRTETVSVSSPQADRQGSSASVTSIESVNGRRGNAVLMEDLNIVPDFVVPEEEPHSLKNHQHRSSPDPDALASALAAAISPVPTTSAAVLPFSPVTAVSVHSTESNNEEDELIPGTHVKPSGVGPGVLAPNQVIRLGANAGNSKKDSSSPNGPKLGVLQRLKSMRGSSWESNGFMGGPTANSLSRSGSMREHKNNTPAKGADVVLQTENEDGSIDAATPAANPGTPAASGLGSVAGLSSPNGTSGSQAIMRITAKDVSVGEGLFSSSMEWNQLVNTNNPLALAFQDTALEKQFQSHFFTKYLVPNRRGLISFLIALMLLGIYETLLHLPETSNESKYMTITWLLRLFALLLGVGLFTFTHTHKAFYEKIQQPLLTFVWGMMGFSMITILILLDTYTEVYGVTVVLLLLTMTSTFVGLQFRWVMGVTITFLLWYLFSALIASDTFPLVVFFLLASNVLAITASRSSEFYLRWDFIRHLKLQLEERRTRHFLDNMLPFSVIQEIKSDRRFIAHEFYRASVMFSDIVSFTALASRIPPEDVVAILNV
jgi:class 3 adenylate cyclase